ncbi:bifunctional epoxide hydrolase 2-like [Anneissia japonica]|uniref:bifunctional epoxide hydrolase 2-like n=1 Tax=Anneissia japonica TaxID=1529436 RepID=UPI001425BB71|nr:bifunctional epoxide hydrolase 2-like [Anneissia japonica]
MFGLLHSTSFVYWKALSNLARNRCLLSRSRDLLSAASCSNMKPSTPAVKAVIFDLGGVILEQPQRGLRRYAESLGFPGFFLESVMIRGRPHNSFCRMERGEISVTQFYREFEAECQEAAKDEGLKLPSSFRPESMWSEMHSVKPVAGMLQALIALKQAGLKTCVLTNNYIDDTSSNRPHSHFMMSLKSCLDEIIESCRVGLRKPDPEIYRLTCDRLQVKPSEAVFLDDLGQNLKPAKELGIQTILVRDVDKALNELKEATGIDVFKTPRPLAAQPSKVSHCNVDLKDGIRIHYVDYGSGPPVIFCHGFPESWYSWRYQIPALGNAGYRVIALDQRGYGDSSNPPDIEAYTQEKLCGDVIGLMDVLGLPQASIVGHDWGGAVVWNLALMYPERIRCVAGLNTPFFPPNPKSNPWHAMQKDPGRFDYQMYFQTPGVAEAEFEGDLERTFKIMFRSRDPKDALKSPQNLKISTGNVRERGGLLVGSPDNVARSVMLTEEDLQYYIKQFKKSGFRGPLNWYRNIEANWKWMCKAAGRKIYAPSLMITAGRDTVLTPASSKHMEKWIPNLKRGHIEVCNHWTQVERPKEVNEMLINWLNGVHASTDTIEPSKL